VVWPKWLVPGAGVPGLAAELINSMRWRRAIWTQIAFSCLFPRV
jgi:hypothetical protein